MRSWMLQTCYEEEFILGRMIVQVGDEIRRERGDWGTRRRSGMAVGTFCSEDERMHERY